MSTVEAIRNIKDLKKIEKILLKKNYRDYVLFKFGINSGLRISDLLSLDVKDIKNKKFISITEKKTQKHRKIPLNPDLRKILCKYILNKKLNQPLFMSKNKNRLERTYVYKMLNDACKIAGIEGTFGTHTLRKTFGYHYYKKYKDVAMLQKIFNHSSPTITLIYIGITQDEIYKSHIRFFL